ncbi:MAG: PEP-CTERM sorting domain-containing protein [Pirellulales bacterium]
MVNDQGDGIATHQMRMVLTSGNIVEQGGGNTPPSQTDIDDIPRRRWDSFVAGGFATAEEGPPPTPAARSSSLAFGGPGGAPPSFANTGYDVAWGVLGPISQNVTHYLSARLTLTNTANGTIGYQTVFNDGTSYCAGCQQQAPPPGNNGGGAQPLFRIVNGVIIPEPASISLASLAMFGLIGLVRRRK